MPMFRWQRVCHNSSGLDDLTSRNILPWFCSYAIHRLSRECLHHPGQVILPPCDPYPPALNMGGQWQLPLPIAGFSGTARTFYTRRRQRRWKLSSQNDIQGLCAGPGRRRHMSHTRASSQQPAREPNTPATYIDLGAGVGAVHYVLNNNGLRCVFANEPDPGNRLAFERNHAPGILDSRDMSKIPLKRIPDHTLLVAWRFFQGASSLRQKGRRSWRDSILDIVQAKKPPIVLVGTHAQLGPCNPHRTPTSRANSSKFAVHMTLELEQLGYRTTLAYYNHDGFNLPLNRRNLFIVGVRADQNAHFNFKPPPGPSPGLGLHQCLLSPEAAQRGDGLKKMETQLVDGVWLPQHRSTAGKLGGLAWTNLNALPQNRDGTPYIPVGHFLGSDGPTSRPRPIYHHLGFARSLGGHKTPGFWYLAPGPDGLPMIRRLLVREAARLQGFPDGFLFAPRTLDARQQVLESISPPMLDWIVKAMKEQFPQIF